MSRQAAGRTLAESTISTERLSSEVGELSVEVQKGTPGEQRRETQMLAAMGGLVLDGLVKRGEAVTPRAFVDTVYEVVDACVAPADVVGAQADDERLVALRAEAAAVIGRDEAFLSNLGDEVYAAGLRERGAYGVDKVRHDLKELGKTLLLRAVHGEEDRKFFSLALSRFGEMERLERNRKQYGAHSAEELRSYLVGDMIDDQEGPEGIPSDWAFELPWVAQRFGSLMADELAKRNLGNDVSPEDYASVWLDIVRACEDDDEDHVGAVDIRLVDLRAFAEGARSFRAAAYLIGIQLTAAFEGDDSTKSAAFLRDTIGELNRWLLR